MIVFGRYKLNKEADSIMHDFLIDKEVFSDLMNAYYFDGQQIVCPQDLYELDTKELNRQRDIAMRWKNENHDVILCIENQSYIDKKMARRIVVYDALRYKKLESKSELEPYVCTLVVYTGEKPWKKYLNFDDTRIFDDVFQNYGIKLKLEIFSFFEYKKYSFKSKKMKDVLTAYEWVIKDMFRGKKEQDFKLSYELARVVYVLTGNMDILNFIEPDEEGVVDMYKVWRDLKRESIQEGRLEGKLEERASILEKILEYIKQGLTPEEIYQRLLEQQ